MVGVPGDRHLDELIDARICRLHERIEPRFEHDRTIGRKDARRAPSPSLPVVEDVLQSKHTAAVEGLEREVRVAQMGGI
jgi:hypothetical protein